MDLTSIPALPHLPAVEAWRESTYPLALRRSPLLQTLDDALEAYENSFRRYNGISQTYYLTLNAVNNEPGSRGGLELQTVRQQAEAAFSRAVHDFEAVDIAFNTWVNSGEGATVVSEVRELHKWLIAGRSQLSGQPPEPAVPQQRRDRTERMPAPGQRPQQNPGSVRSQVPVEELRTVAKVRSKRRSLPPR